MGAAAQFLVGTASWTDPTLVKSDLFYPPTAKTAEARLGFYATQFPTVEVDASYYSLLSRKVAQLWAERTPPHFVFNVKAFAWLTLHAADAARLPAAIKEALPPAMRTERRINNPPPDALALAFEMFWSALEPLRDARKLGMTLFQFPPFVTDRSNNRQYISSLPERMPGAAIAVEFRHKSWLDGAARSRTMDFLRANGLAYVSVDAPKAAGIPPILEATGPDAYIRFHGHNERNWFRRDVTVAERYKYLYSERELAEWADRIKRLEGVRRAFAIFNNCYANFGVMNAGTMARMLSRE
ncbi:MAG TPA: DUF72 domain-containing protein [Candidatus Binataceae bacterium]|nr:DUF72 domain-containing protein [Candidatus Binataceae bacterium]